LNLQLEIYLRPKGTMTVRSGYYENPADGLVFDMRSQTDRRFLQIRYFLLHEGSLKLLLTSLMWTISILVPGF